MTFKSKHAEQESNLSSPVLEAGVPPLELSARDDASPKCAGQDSNLCRPKPTRLQRATIATLSPAQRERDRSQQSQRGRIRTFDPVRPRHVRCQTALHAEEI